MGIGEKLSGTATIDAGVGAALNGVDAMLLDAELLDAELLDAELLDAILLDVVLLGAALLDAVLFDADTTTVPGADVAISMRARLLGAS